MQVLIKFAYLPKALIAALRVFVGLVVVVKYRLLSPPREEKRVCHPVEAGLDQVHANLQLLAYYLSKYLHI